MSKVSIYQIAKETGVSASTVSRVMNKKPGISEATRMKVEGILKHYGFYSDYPKSRTAKIAVIYPWPELSDYFRKAMKGIYAVAQENELSVNIIIKQSLRKESILEAIRDQQCSGVIAMLCEYYKDDILALAKTQMPVVLLDSNMEYPNIGFIDNDSYSGSYMAAKHLADLGHKKVGFLAHDNSSLNHLQRFKATENYFRSNDVSMTPEMIVNLAAEEASLERGRNGYIAMNELLSRKTGVTAVMAIDDSMAFGAMAAIYDAGLSVPDDISLIGFGNYPETKFWRPSLTTVDHPIEKSGIMAAESLSQAINNPGEWTPPREILHTELVVRKSTSTAKTKKQ